MSQIDKILGEAEAIPERPYYAACKPLRSSVRKEFLRSINLPEQPRPGVLKRFGRYLRRNYFTLRIFE